mgnify:CR=1 FL=1
MSNTTRVELIGIEVDGILVHAEVEVAWDAEPDYRQVLLPGASMADSDIYLIAPVTDGSMDHEVHLSHTHDGPLFAIAERRLRWLRLGESYRWQSR